MVVVQRSNARHVHLTRSPAPPPPGSLPTCPSAPVPPPALCTDDNELLTLEVIHQFVEILDKYFGNVCELDLIFNFHKV